MIIRYEKGKITQEYLEEFTTNIGYEIDDIIKFMSERFPQWYQENLDIIEEYDHVLFNFDNPSM